MSVLNAWRDWHRPLMLHVLIMAGVMLVSAVGLLVDDRTLLGEPVWLKPLKFGFAFGVYGATLAWLLSKLRKAKRTAWAFGLVFALGSSLDVVVIALAAGRGTFSHFNIGTDAFAQFVALSFQIGVSGAFISNLVFVVLVLIQRAVDRPMATALRFGLFLSTAAMVVPVFLSGASGPEPRTVADAAGNPVKLAGGHGVGDPDGNGVPLTNWNADGGDLRVPHFVGLHGIQVLILVAVLLAALAAGRSWLRDDRVRARLVRVLAIGYSGVFATVVWQAARDQSVISPDAKTLAGLAASAVFTVVAATIVVLLGKRSAARELGSR